MDAEHHANNRDWRPDSLVCAVLLGAVALIVTAAVLCHVSAACRLLI